MAARCFATMVSTDIAAVRAVRALLDDAGYAADSISALLQIPGELRVTAGDLVRAGFLLDPVRPLDALVRVLLLGGTIPSTTARRALGDGVDLLCRVGLASVEQETMRPNALLVPHGGLVVASDPFGAPDYSWVPGVQRPSDLLACATPRRPVARALDLGTGNGIQALLLSDHVANVVAVDVNDHALALARLNAVLNGRDDRIEFRQGDFLEPVANERFDLIVSNPPYVVSPENSYVFRDADTRGDVMCRDLVHVLPRYLEADGLAVLMVSWSHDDRESPAPQQWMHEADADGVLLVLAVHNALDAAMLWNAPYLADGNEFARRVGAWRDYFTGEDISSIGHGVVAMRRTPDGCAPVTAALPPTAPPGRRGGDQLERVVRALGRSERDGTPTVLALAPDIVLSEVSRPTADGTWATAANLSVADGLSFSIGLDASGARLVHQFALPTEVDRALDSFPELGAEGRAKAASFLDELVRLGLLVPVDE